MIHESLSLAGLLKLFNRGEDALVGVPHEHFRGPLRPGCGRKAWPHRYEHRRRLNGDADVTRNDGDCGSDGSGDERSFRVSKVANVPAHGEGCEHAVIEAVASQWCSRRRRWRARFRCREAHKHTGNGSNSPKNEQHDHENQSAHTRATRLVQVLQGGGTLR